MGTTQEPQPGQTVRCWVWNAQVGLKSKDRVLTQELRQIKSRGNPLFKGRGYKER